jgi:hypothetical protein
LRTLRDSSDDGATHAWCTTPDGVVESAGLGRGDCSLDGDGDTIDESQTDESQTDESVEALPASAAGDARRSRTRPHVVADPRSR